MINEKIKTEVLDTRELFLNLFGLYCGTLGNGDVTTTVKQGDTIQVSWPLKMSAAEACARAQEITAGAPFPWGRRVTYGVRLTDEETVVTFTNFGVLALRYVLAWDAVAHSTAYQTVVRVPYCPVIAEALADFAKAPAEAGTMEYAGRHHGFRWRVALVEGN